MFRFNNDAGQAGDGSLGSPGNSNGYRHGRGRLRGDDFGLTARPSLLGLGRTYLETQARLWPELAGTPAAPTITDAVVEAMADAFERRFRTQLVDVVNPAGLRRVWTDIGLGYVRFSDERSNPRSLDQQLATQVRLIGASDGFDTSNQQSKVMLAMMRSFNEVFIDQLKANVRRGRREVVAEVCGGWCGPNETHVKTPRGTGP